VNTVRSLTSPRRITIATYTAAWSAESIRRLVYYGVQNRTVKSAILDAA